MNTLLAVFLLLNAGPNVLATASTEFDRRDEGRAWNIALAAARIDGAVLRPGESFSFNRTVGPRGLEDGFRPAPELVDGDRVEGIGGGVCQVASTLYAAALEAGLTIEARRAHSRPAAYIRPGLDATVSFSRGVDLVVRNDSDAPVALRATAGGGRLAVAVRRAVPAAAAGQITVEAEATPHAAGLEVIVFRRTDYADGTSQREFISRDSYRGAG